MQIQLHEQIQIQMQHTHADTYTDIDPDVVIGHELEFVMGPTNNLLRWRKPEATITWTHK